MWVVKLGGSLMHSQELSSWLGVLASFGGGRIVIVPGGGAFADQVRQAQSAWGFDDRIAHHMAILAMEQYGLMMTGIRRDLRVAASLPQVEATLREAAVPVWLPAAMTVDNAELPERWDLSSDSLAAWFADQCGAEMLILVKSVELAEASVAAIRLSASGVVDPLFPLMAAAGRYETRLMGKAQHGMMERMLVTGMPAGTIVTVVTAESARRPATEPGPRGPRRRPPPTPH